MLTHYEAVAVAAARAQRPIQPLEVLASADRDVRINAPRLLNALTFTSAQEALVFADTSRVHRDALEELMELARARADRLGMQTNEVIHG